MPLICENASLTIASQRLNELAKHEPELFSLLLELTITINLTEAYDKTWSSIFWKDANPRTRKRVEETLNDLAYKIADHLEESMRLFNEICDRYQFLNCSQDELYSLLNNLSYSISTTYKTIKQLTQPRQLKLL